MTFNHERQNTSVCIDKVENEILFGSFFNKQPKVGDFIKSFIYNNSGTKFEVTEILNKEDAIIQHDCTHDPHNAKMKIKVITVLDN